MATSAEPTAAPSVDEIRRRSEERGVEFYFAQFVDMYARPSAKLVPAQNLDSLGEEWPYDPRTMLRRQLDKARQKGYEFKFGVELEYFLVQQSNGGIELADQYDTLEKPCYDLNGLTRNYDFLAQVSRYVNQLGWGNYANDHEDANGQFEQNFEFADALTSADRAIFFRYMVHTLAEQAGKIATFMAKPFSHLTGNGGHFHMFLWG